MNDPIWLCKDGRQMHIHEMDDRHLQNCINLIGKARSRGKSWRTEYLDRLVLEQTIRNMGLTSRRRL